MLVCNDDRMSSSADIFLCPFLFSCPSPLYVLTFSLPQGSSITLFLCVLTIKKADKIYSPKKYKNSSKWAVCYKFKSRPIILNYNLASLLFSQNSLATFLCVCVANLVLTLIFIRVTVAITDVKVKQHILCKDATHAKLSV